MNEAVCFQGYTDLNFLIPEIISGIDYRKGPYYAPRGGWRKEA